MIYSGGCQCGKVRYQATAPRDRSSVCYCRMCQKASGGPFMAFVRFPADQVSWTSPPAVFASSNRVERGFCRDCGTPLTYRAIDGPNISLTLNSLDDPGGMRPGRSFSTAARPSWCLTLDELPDQEMDLITEPDFINYQYPDQ